MAARYWVGNTGVWDASTTTNWSTSSGGTGGASVPTSSDDVIFDASSFTLAGQTVSLSDIRSCGNLDFSAVANTPQVYFSGFASVYIKVYGNLTLSPNIFLFADGTFQGEFHMLAASGTKTIDFGGLTTDAALQIEGAGTFNLLSTLTLWDLSSAVGGGVFNTNNHTLQIRSFTPTEGTFNFGSSTITVTGSLIDSPGSNIWTVSNTQPALVINAVAATINVQFLITDSGFATTPQTYGTIVFDTGQLARFSLNGGVTIDTLQLNPAQELFLDGNFDGQFTVTNFIAHGTSVNHIIIHCDGIPDQFDMVAANVSLSYVEVADGNALGAASPFTVVNGVDNGNNTNWLFTGGASPAFNNTPGAYNPLAYGSKADAQQPSGSDAILQKPAGNIAAPQTPSGSDVLQQKPIGGTISTGKPNLA